jgi:hypothetical protein
MDLKERFNQHTTDPNQLAWREFDKLRKDKKKKLVRFWLIFGSGLFLVLMLTTTVFWQDTSEKRDRRVQLVKTERSKTFTDEQQLTELPNADQSEIKRSFHSKIEPSNSDHISLSRNIQVEHEAVKKQTIIQTNNNKPQSSTNPAAHVTERSADINDPYTISNKPLNSTTIDHLNITENSPESQNLSDLDRTSENLLSPFIQTRLEDNELIEPTSSQDDNTTYLSADIQPLNTDRIRPPLSHAEDLNEEEELAPEIHFNKNHFSVTLGSAQGFIDGFALENPVEKRGINLQIEYYRLWSRLIGTGITAGYINGIDIANPSLELRDQEEILYVHVNLYLFLYNQDPHRFYLNFGAGPTRTNRILGGSSFDVNQNVSRTLQINTLKSLGITVSASYDYQLSNHWVVGLRGTVISHNDGGWTLGILGGYNF